MELAERERERIKVEPTVKRAVSTRASMIHNHERKLNCANAKCRETRLTESFSRNRSKLINFLDPINSRWLEQMKIRER